MAWYPFALNNALKDKKLSKVLYYSGHGVPDPEPSRSDLSPVPATDYAPVRDMSREKVGVLSRGDWPLHGCGFLGLKCLVHACLDDLGPMAVNCEKELLIIADSCFSGKWCDDMSEIISEIAVPANCFITIQAAAAHLQCAHAGIFTPVLCELQKEDVRNEWLEAFKCMNIDDLRSSYRQYLELQSPQFYSTRPADNTSDPIAFVECLNGSESSFCLFRCPVFFWFCAERLNLIGVLDECNLNLMKVNIKMSTVEVANMKIFLSGSTIVGSSFERYTGNVNKAAGTCENTYLPKVRIRNGTREIEVHVHYNDSVGGPMTVGEVTFKQVNCMGTVEPFLGAQKLDYKSQGIAEQTVWAADIQKIVNTAATAARFNLADDTKWKAVNGVKVAKSFTFEQLDSNDRKRKAFSWDADD